MTNKIGFEIGGIISKMMMTATHTDLFSLYSLISFERGTKNKQNR